MHQNGTWENLVSIEVCNTLANRTKQEAEILNKLGRLQEREVDARHATDKHVMESCGGEISRLLRERG